MTDRWPILYLDSEPRIAARPDWRYPANPDFFELRTISRIDWASREVDLHAKRADGLMIYVARKMTWWETIWYNPRFDWLRYHLGNIPLRVRYWRDQWVYRREDKL